MTNKNFSPWIYCDLEQWGPLTNEKYLINVKEKNVLYNQEEDISHIYIVKSGRAVSYTHLTLPTNREVEISVVAVSLKKTNSYTHLTVPRIYSAMIRETRT